MSRLKVAMALTLCLVATIPVLPAEAATAPATGPIEDIYPFGDAVSYGSTAALHPAAPVVGMATTPSTNGYWEAAADGGVFAFGDAAFHGSLGGAHLNAPIVAVAASQDGQGYWTAAADGGVFAFGDAPFFGSLGGRPLNQPIVAMAVTPSGRGYWLAAADGGVFAFGDAPFFGSLGGRPLNRPIVGMAVRSAGDGYWLAASDGGVFAFGAAPFLGSLGGTQLNAPITGVAARPLGDGYWMSARDGGVFAFGSATFQGSLATVAVHQAIVGMAPTFSGQGYWLVTASRCELQGGTGRRQSEPASDEMFLTDLGHFVQPCYEQVVFQFKPDTTAVLVGWDLGYRAPPFLDTAGRRVPVAGSAFLFAHFEPSSTFDVSNNQATYTGPHSVKPSGTTRVREVRLVDDFEANMGWVIGLDRVRPFNVVVLKNPDRVVVEIG